MELILDILECYLRHGQPLSPKALSIKARISEAKAKCFLLALQRRGYLKKAEDSHQYVVTGKIMTLT